MVVAIWGYVETPKDLCTFKAVFTGLISDECKRHFSRTGTNIRRPLLQEMQDNMRKTTGGGLHQRQVMPSHSNKGPHSDVSASSVPEGGLLEADPGGYRCCL